MRVAVIGSGYVGLTTGACLAHLGHEVVCADVVPERVEALSRGEIPIVEDGLEDMVRGGLEAGRLSFVLGEQDAAEGAEFVFLCVPTPQGADGSADMSYIQRAAQQIGPVLVPESVVINKSTVPVGSARVVEQALGRSDVFVVSNPEFLREGSAVHDFLHPDRIVIGADDQAAAIRVTELFEGIKAPFVVTDPATAEAIKYASNAFLATKVSFINAVANLCEAVGANVREVVLGMGYDKRIGFEFLRPGPGWGGSCFVPDETVLAHHRGRVRLLTFEELFALAGEESKDGWEVVAWVPGEPGPEFHPVSAFTVRPWDGEVLEVRTGMGRRLVTTPDHPFVVGNGVDGEQTAIKPASDLQDEDWLPVAVGSPWYPDRPEHPPLGDREWEAAGRACDSSGRVPDLVWSTEESAKRAFLRGLWDGGGSWSHAAGGPSVVLDWCTHSRRAADGALRLLGELGVVARLEVGPAPGSAVDTFRLTVGGEPSEYRRLSKNTAWVRVVSVEPRRYRGPVFSLEVRHAATVVATGGLVAHNCFPKDTRALVRIAEDAGYDFGLLKGVIGVNDEQYERVVAKVVRILGGAVEGATVAAWGLTFKARTDDLRESPALEIIGRLTGMGAKVRAYDPTVHRPLDGMEVAADPYDACDDADVLVVLTEWDEFRWLDLGVVRTRMAQPRIVDARNLLEPATARRAGFRYDGLGLA